MTQWINHLLVQPSVLHLRRMQERFGQRQGNQFAGAVAYFSLLSIVPILMLAFSALGFTLTVIRPDVLAQLGELVTARLGETDGLGTTVRQLIEDALGNWGTIGILGALTAGWSGAGWVASLKGAVRTQLRADPGAPEHKRSLPLETLVNLGILVVLLVVLGAGLAASALATSLAGSLAIWTGLPTLPGGEVMLRALSLLVSLAAGFALFAFLFRVLPEDRQPRAARLRAALAGSIGLSLLQYLAGFLIGVFAGNPAAALFGPVIILLLFFNLFATLVLLLAAWMGTAQAPAATPVLPDPAQATAATERPGMVNEAVARRAMGVGLTAGYVTGAATGIGVGAVIAAIAARLPRRRP